MSNTPTCTTLEMRRIRRGLWSIADRVLVVISVVISTITCRRFAPIIDAAFFLYIYIYIHLSPQDLPNKSGLGVFTQWWSITKTSQSSSSIGRKSYEDSFRDIPIRTGNRTRYITRVIETQILYNVKCTLHVRNSRTTRFPVRTFSARIRSREKLQTESSTPSDCWQKLTECPNGVKGSSVKTS